jgi:hypothetical protein
MSSTTAPPAGRRWTWPVWLSPPAMPHWPAHWVVMGVLFTGAIGVGFELLPGQVQRVAMLERDGQTLQARALLERSFASGDRSPRTLLQLEALYEQLGELDKAREKLALLLQRSPRDATVLRRAAAFYKMTQDREAYIRTLQAQLDIKYTEEGCRELIGLFRSQSVTDAEQATLQRCRQRGYRRPDDMIRLASLVASDGETLAAATILRGVDDLRRLKNDRDRTNLTALLLELDQPRDAQRRALRWLRGTRETSLALSLIDLMAIANRHDFAIELAREISAPGDAISLAVAELMLDRGEPVAAKSYLRGWIEKARFDNPDIISRFIVACLDAEDPENAMAGVKRYGLTKISQPDLVALAEAHAATGRQQDFDLVRAAIRPEVIAENPLLGAAVALQRGAPEASQSLLSTVAVDELDEWRLSLWARLMNRTGGNDVAATALRRLGVEAQAEPVVQAQPGRVAVEPQMIRRPKRTVRTKFRRFQQVQAIRAKRGVAGQQQPPAPAFGPGDPSINR